MSLSAIVKLTHQDFISRNSQPFDEVITARNASQSFQSRYFHFLKIPVIEFPGKVANVQNNICAETVKDITGKMKQLLGVLLLFSGQENYIDTGRGEVIFNYFAKRVEIAFDNLYSGDLIKNVVDSDDKFGWHSCSNHKILIQWNKASSDIWNF